MKETSEAKNIAVFASGFGSNLQALLDFSQREGLGAEIKLVFSDNKQAYALERASQHNIKSFTFSPAGFASRHLYDLEILDMLKKEKIDLVVLAGYMRLVGKEILENYPLSIINIHPALLPSFKGTHGIADAYNYGVKVTGVTIHFVDEGLDSGPIIMQEAVIIEDIDTLETLEEKIHKVEHKLYPLAVRYLCQGRLGMVGRKVLLKR